MKRRLWVLPLCLAASVSIAREGSDDLFPRIEMQTSAGRIVVELDRTRAPLTVANFLQYVDDGFYDGTIFHRVVADFVAQGGGYTPDFEEKAAREPVVNESGNGLSNMHGTLAMARTNDPHSATAQFFFNLADNARLDPSPARWGYAVFGRVVEGLGVVDDIGRKPTGPGGTFDSEVPQATVLIEKVRVLPPAATTDSGL